MQALLCLLSLAFLPAADPTSKIVTLTVSAGKFDRPPGPARVSLVLPEDLATGTAVVRSAAGHKVAAQLTGMGLLNSTSAPAGKVSRELHLLLPALKADESFDVRVEILKDSAPTQRGFAWKDTPGKNSELFYDGKPVLRYECEPLDNSTKQRREATYKVYHHLYADDGTLVTKGPGGLYTHHRGLFYGFRKTTYDGNKEVDIWHCTGDTAQVHEKILSADAGPILGRHRVLIDWLGKGKEVFAREERELTVWNLPGGRLVEFASVLHPERGTVKVDGDPQHSGFHFRASNEVAPRWHGQARCDPQLAGSEGPRQLAVGRDELRPRWPALHGGLSRPSGESEGSTLQ